MNYYSKRHMGINNIIRSKPDSSNTFYYPWNENGTLNEIDSVSPPLESRDDFLQFYTKNANVYQPISQNVKVVLYLNPNLTKVNWRICNYVTLAYKDYECNAYITSYDLIQFEDQTIETSLFALDKAFLFLVDNSNCDFRSLSQQISYMIQICDIKTKGLLFDWIISQYHLIEMIIDVDMMNDRINILKQIEDSCYDYIVRDPNDDIPRPCIGVIFLIVKRDLLSNCPNDNNSLSSIVINLKDETNDASVIKGSLLTYITYHFPFESSKHYCINNKIDVLKKYAKIHHMEYMINSTLSVIHLEHREPLLNLEHRESLLNLYNKKPQDKRHYFYYQQSIGFGSSKPKGLTKGIIESDINLGQSCHGTIVFDDHFKPIGLVFEGNDTSLNVFKEDDRHKMPNFLIPFDNIGMVYLMLKYIGKVCNINELVEKHAKNFLKEHDMIICESLIDNNDTPIEGDNEEDIEESMLSDKKKTNNSSSNISLNKEKPNQLTNKHRNHFKDLKKEKFKLGLYYKDSKLKSNKSVNSKLNIFKKRKQIKEDKDMHHKAIEKKRLKETLPLSEEMYTYDKTFLQIKRKRERVSLSKFKKFELK